MVWPKGKPRSEQSKRRASETLRGRRVGVENSSYKDGRTLHPLFQCWKDMMNRCYDAARKSHQHYGGRGIAVCTEWHDPLTFYRYADEILGPRPKGCSLDRINNDGSYEPGNIRWATLAQQLENRRPYKTKRTPEAGTCNECGGAYKDLAIHRAKSHRGRND